MKKMACFVLLALVTAAPAAGQSSRVYVAGTLAADSGSRGPVDTGTITTGGAAVGLRLSHGWSLEMHVDRGIGSKTRTDEGPWLSFGPPSGSFEEFERRAVHARFDRTDTPKTGYSTLAVWRTREAGRVNAAIFGGVSWRQFHQRVVRTITRIPEGVPLDNPNLTDGIETRRLTGGGLTGGFMIPVSLRRSVTVAPELRFTLGVITDESTYKALHTGVRVMWGF